jgi:O-methyltransferase domain/Dimerisation domain
MDTPADRTRPRIDPPSCDDRLLWDLWVSRFHLPAVAVADELRLFSLLDEAPASASEIAQRLSLSERGAEALLAVLTGLGFLRQLGGRFHLTEPAREFMLPDRPYYWGGVFAAYRLEVDRASPGRLLASLREDPDAEQRRATVAWQAGELPPESARIITAYMHAHSFPSAVGFARRADFRGVQRLLDVGGGSGCFSIAVAMRHPSVSCTIMDLRPVCAIATSYVAQYGLLDCIDTMAADFFRDAWPRNHQAVLLSNILHDWDPAQCHELLVRAFESLPPGGRIFIHEALLGDGRDDDLTTASYSLQMATGTLGKQFTADELTALLRGAGFDNPRCTHSFYHFWTVTADRP